MFKTKHLYYLEPPRIDLESYLLEGLKLTAGSVMQIQVKVQGTPTPAVTWLKDDLEVKSIQRHQIIVDGEHASLVVSDCCRDDSGIYTIQVQNACGEKKSEIKAIIYGIFIFQKYVIT